MTDFKQKYILVSAPSGAGKTTLVKHILHSESSIGFSISATSRYKREGEIEGRDYYFLSAQDFQNKIQEGEFLEWEEVYAGQFYGTLSAELQRLALQKKHIIFDIDVQGGIRLKRKLGAEALSIFIQPPHENALEERLRYRSTESEEKIKTRLAKAHEELKTSNQFDLIIVNDQLEQAKEEILTAVKKFIK
jgi:guanylate kinase